MMIISHIRSFHQKDNCILLMVFFFLGCLTGSSGEEIIAQLILLLCIELTLCFCRPQESIWNVS